MKLKEFNIENTGQQRAGVPSININGKFGLLDINRFATELVGLTKDDQIIIHQDEDEPENWYLEKVKKGGFMLRQTKKESPSLQFNHCGLARKIIEGMGGNGKLKVLVAGEPTVFEKRKLWGLLKRSVE